MKSIPISLIFIAILSLLIGVGELHAQISDRSHYLATLKEQLALRWPKNQTINLVFHGHSVPAGYFITPDVQTLSAYPYQSLKKIKDAYPRAVVNSIVTAIGGEHSVSGAKRFSKEVLTHRPDVVFIDYGLNDRSIGLERAKKAWEKMIKKALKKGVKIILLTPTPDLKEDILAEDVELSKHAAQIRALATSYQVGLVDSYRIFQEIAKKEDLKNYMAQGNHINALGHELVAREIKAWFQNEIESPLPGYQLAWFDEFDGHQLDRSKWGYRTDNKHRSIQRKSNVSLQNGALVLALNTHQEAIDGQFASGAGIVSKAPFQYGYYEVRAKIGDGIDDDQDGKTDEGWYHIFGAMIAAFDDQGEVESTPSGTRRMEINGFENFSEHLEDYEQNGLGRFTQQVTLWGENGKEPNRLPTPPDNLTMPKHFNSSDWHIYGFEWTEQEVKFYVDYNLTVTAEYPSNQFSHDQLHVWLTAIATHWDSSDQEPSRAEYDYFRFFKKR
ncbi:MAG: family 16 glycosylhydrolase [Saprospiraceae bacterium]|nr:family 16 glycosylhydrolase [Saprospiraceae bacterium]